jgi:phosphatidylglycerol:prolipoprotein diacylglycerol transferase
MQRTLFLVPHEVAGLPVAGFGWLLIFVGVALAIRLLVARKYGQPVGQLLASEGLMWGIVMAVIAFVMPRIELQNVDGQPVGMAIRWYGVMLLTGVASAVVLAAYRAYRRGLDPELIFAMALPTLIGGFIGARLFYVIQYRDKFIDDSVSATIANMLDFTGGGLVVYGSFIGGFIAAATFVLRHRLPFWKLGDVLVPCLFIGVFFGRIGCLMNGCCYGGRCEDHWWALNFPPGSAVYSDQIASGELLGLRFDPLDRRISEVRRDSLADRAGIVAGSRLDEIAIDPSPRRWASKEIPAEDALLGVIATVDGRRYRWTPQELPSKALPVQAAQVISSLSALTLCLLLCAASWVFKRDGVIMLLGFAGYAVVRFGLEWIRVDEAGQFGTPLSISQCVSVVVFTLSVIGLVWIYRNPVEAEPSAGAVAKG